MVEGEAAPRRPLPWTFRLFTAIPLPPALVGVGIFVGLLTVYFGIEFARGQIARVAAGTAPEHIPGHFRSAVITALFLAYLPTAQVYLARWTRKNLADLQPLLAAAEPDGHAGSADAGALASPAGRVAGIATMLFLIALFLLIPEGISQYLSSDYWIFEHAWDNALIVPIGWLGGRLVYAIAADALRMSRLASRIPRVDLLDLSPVSPFVRQGLRSALLAVLLISIASGQIGNVVVSPASLTVVLGAMLAVASVALLLPVYGVRRRIREEKRARLAELRARIRSDERAALQNDREADRARAGLPGLLALEARLENVREWPFDSSSLLRLAFYLTIGLGSWLGAALVERLLDRALS